MAITSELPPLPSYTLTIRPPLIWPIPDNILILLLPIIAYWTMSMFFHWLDVNDYFPQYRLHTPAEVLKRNHVTRWEVVRDVIIQQVIQTAFGMAILFFDKPETSGKDQYDVAVWATRIRMAQHIIPSFTKLLGIDSLALAGKLTAYPMLAGALSGGSYPSLTQTITSSDGILSFAPAFAPWEMATAGVIYWYLIPALQFFYAVFFLDTWQYFLHRAMHMNKWLYTTFHSRHHRLYVPYAFGALYNHPFEGFLLDTAGTGLAFITCAMTTRQGMWFFTCSTIKTIDDHCGYAFPWDPLQHITSNNAAYHDIHHQSWGIKTNFSQPFFTFWDRLLNTRWRGGDVTLKYERSRLASQKLVEQDNQRTEEPALPNGKPSPEPLDEPNSPNGNATPVLKEDEDACTRNIIQRSVRKTTNSFSPQADNLKGFSHRLNGSIRQK
ncbi:hypothetical protein FQN57_000187 [Myotisia sp. PD_48]|nr:hypothetical protein FQN57_000187 [Myotisia sp. PD_48]